MFIFSFLKLGLDFIAGRAIALFNMRMQIATFIIDRWRVFLVLAILSLGAIHYLSLRNQVNTAKTDLKVAKKALIVHLEADSDAAKKREADNKLNAILAQKKTDAKALEHESAITAIYTKQKGLKHEIAINKRDIANWRERVRIEVINQNNAAPGVPENDTSGLASGNSDTTLPRPIHEAETELATCKEAGAIAAADYNFCKSYVEVQQSILGVSK